MYFETVMSGPPPQIKAAILTVQLNFFSMNDFRSTSGFKKRTQMQDQQ